jgi:hypothetical protein
MSSNKLRAFGGCWLLVLGVGALLHGGRGRRPHGGGDTCTQGRPLPACVPLPLTSPQICRLIEENFCSGGNKGGDGHPCVQGPPPPPFLRAMGHCQLCSSGPKPKNNAPLLSGQTSLVLPSETLSAVFAGSESPGLIKFSAFSTGIHENSLRKSGLATCFHLQDAWGHV